jgi:hypothetical protein
VSRNLVIIALLAGVIAAAGIAVVLTRGGPRDGAGAYAEEVVRCQDDIFGTAMHPADMVFEDDTEWHEASRDHVEVGGVLSVLNEAGQRVGHNYDCAFERGILQTANLR